LGFKKPQIIKGIRISFIFPAKKYKIFGLLNDISNKNYVLLISQENNDLFELFHEMQEVKVLALRIIFEAYHETKSFFHGQFLFAMKSLKFISSTSKVKLSQCLPESDFSIASQEYSKQNFFFVPHIQKSPKNQNFKEFLGANQEKSLAQYLRFINSSGNQIFSNEYLNFLQIKVTQMVDDFFVFILLFIK